MKPNTGRKQFHFDEKDRMTFFIVIPWLFLLDEVSDSDLNHSQIISITETNFTQTQVNTASFLSTITKTDFSNKDIKSCTHVRSRI